ncbi:MAG: hypothetical protein ACRCX2_04560 [Paraclostridium sp.]
MILFELIPFGDFSDQLRGRNLIARTKDNKLVEFGIDVYDINHPTCIKYNYTQPALSICEPFTAESKYSIPVYEAGIVKL